MMKSCMLRIYCVAILAFTFSTGHAEWGEAPPDEPIFSETEAKDLGREFAKCSGKYDAFADGIEPQGHEAGAKQMRGIARGWKVAAWFIYNAWVGEEIGDPEGITSSYAQEGYDKVAALLESTKLSRSKVSMAKGFDSVDEQLEVCESNAELQELIVNIMKEGMYSKIGK